ncbi:hypothetical protein [Thalassobacillus hwangdonensis]|uniref:DUF4309 domain-containing protein n=1 Tax=Thalassobacillus hwangdonensis TaxID=546108 RepID=A0ABW3L586_9BACI
MKRLLIISLACVVLMVLAGCDAFAKEKMDYYDETDSTELTGITVDGIGVSSSKSEMINTFGEPDQVDEVGEPPAEYFIYDQVEFGIKNQQVFRFIILESHALNNGIAPGDKMDKVIEILGENYYIREDTGSEILGYFDKENKVSLEFALKDERVSYILMQTLETH